ncbi:hypothetical protein [[Clostridium] colinum]|uniref:hypothetical protein n=1 Tax=[Clostridium] colinum TaxID=36835 RepID=UPI0020248306|nr:hypothetical protein [[Clostridium] colinum]
MYINIGFEDEDIKILRKEFDIKENEFYNIINNLCDEDKNSIENLFYIDFDLLNQLVKKEGLFLNNVKNF